MVARIHYRWDFIGLSTDNKPTPETSEKVVDGSTYYCSDNSKLYVWYKTQWYERKPLGGGGGGGSYTAGTGIDITDDTISVDTTTIQAKLTAGDNITITDDTISATDTTYTAGSNITITNGEISATDTTYSNFTGTDGTAAGTAGLVPAPTTSDTDKYLKSDGSWATVSGGGGTTYTAGDGIDITNSVISATNTGKAKVLTSADYNWPTNNPDGVALWLLEPGVYYSNSAMMYASSNQIGDIYSQGTVIIGNTYNGAKEILYYNQVAPSAYLISTSVANGQRFNKVSLLANITQVTGTSTTDVMSQNAVTSMVYVDPSAKHRIRIGDQADAQGSFGIAIGYGAYQYDSGSYGGSIAIGRGSYATGMNAVALGLGANAITQGQFDISTSKLSSVAGYNNSQYRLLTGLYDGQSAHDAATYGQVISYSAINGAGAPTTATEGRYVGQLYYDTTNEAMYFLKTIDTTTTPTTYTWEALGGGGSGPTVVQTTGTSTTDVMSQNATTSMVFADPATQYKIKIGAGTSSSEGNEGIEIGHNAAAIDNYSVSLGFNSNVSGMGSIGIGFGSTTGARGQVAIGAACNLSSADGQGVVSIGTGNPGYYGYSSSNYRLLTGLYDPQSDHDAATKGYVDPTTDSSAPTTATVGRLGQIFIDTTNAAAYMCVAVDTATPSYTWKQITA